MTDNGSHKYDKTTAHQNPCDCRNRVVGHSYHGGVLMATPNIVIQPGTLTKIEPGATYAVTISQELPVEVIFGIQTKWQNETGSKLIILNGVK